MSASPNEHDLTHQAQLAVGLFQQGQFEPALVQIEQIFRQHPPSPGLLNLAGTCARSLGRQDQAARYWRAALRLQPDNVIAGNNLALLARDGGHPDQAEAIFREMLARAPGHADTQVNLGNLYRGLERIGDAEAAYRAALAGQPDHVDALYNLGLLLITSGRPDEAETTLRRALAVQPDQADVLHSLGNLCMDASRHDEAEDAYRRAIALAPGYVEAHCSLGMLLMVRRRPQEALAAFAQALKIRPGQPDALNCVGNLLKDGGRYIEAEQAYRQALVTNPESAVLHCNLGTVLLRAGRIKEAEHHFRRATAQQPGYGQALGEAAGCALRLHAWQDIVRDRDALLAALAGGCQDIPLLVLFALPGVGALQQRHAATLAAQRHAPAALQPLAVGAARPGAGRRLHVGYLSAEFREHAVMHLFAGVLARHDRDRFKVHAYSIGPASNDAYRHRIEADSEVFRDLSQTADPAAAQRIAEDGIDILVDLTGLTGDARPLISALRPAPAIVNWLGHPGTMGDPRLADYIIGDPVLTPAEHAAHYSEHLALMPHCYQPNDPALAVGPAPTREQAGLPTEGFVFCSFNQSHKLNPEMFTVWCRLLDSVPGSVLWLLRPVDPAAMDNLRMEAAARGVDPTRLLFAPALPLARHLERLQLGDLALDTFPYGSGATGSNVLRAGVPMVTLMGESYVSRMAASQLHALGLPELVATTPGRYYELALALATDPARLAATRARLARGLATSPLFDCERFTRDLEALYEKIWLHTLAGRPDRVLA
jgi:predicted O-linked N-acetylglucosamine transferase (SPINDLY family)